jgi:hypothetical protein
MRLVLWIVATVVVLFFVVPIVAEGSINICQDVALHNVRSAYPRMTENGSAPMYHIVNSAESGGAGSGASFSHVGMFAYTPIVLRCTFAFWSAL